MKKQFNYAVSPSSYIKYRGKKAGWIHFNELDKALDFIYKRRLSKAVLYVNKRLSKKQKSKKYVWKINSVNQVTYIKPMKK